MEEPDHWVELLAVVHRIDKIKADLAEAREQRDKIIIEIHQKGVPVAQIARRIGMSRPAIHNILTEQRTQ